jgi:hypothetical protein
MSHECDLIPGFLLERVSVLTSTGGGHNDADKGSVCLWFGPNVWSHDPSLRVLSEVSSEGFTLPATSGFDQIEGDSSSEVFECRVDADVVAW